jgi:transaldolase
MAELVGLGITGVTSNPSIFEKAVNRSATYDSPIQELGKAGRSVEEICNMITIEDIRSAADILLGIYSKTEALDGYVSLEVNPDYAYDAEETIKQAREIHQAVDRPNLMIKVPGTKEGRKAIRVLTREGVNINVTLLFSVRHYEASATAYIDGIRDRLEDGNPISAVCSVASVFVSRVDTRLDERLANLELDQLKGKIAVANAKMIYQKYRALFFPGLFGEIASKGGHVQRLLWGSTSTKNPAYSDVKYVNELIGQDTINTLPHSTLEAFLDHGTPALSIEKDLEQARKDLDILRQEGVDIDEVCDDIQREGVDAFSASYKKLLDAIAKKSLA